MFSPWIILAAVLAVAAAGVGGYFKGSTDAENKAKAEYAKQLDGVIAQHNKDSLSDMQEAAAMATREAQAKTRTVYIRGAANEAIAKAPAAVNCNLSIDRYNVLLAAVNEANGGADKDAAAAVSRAVRQVNGTEGQSGRKP